MGQCYGSVSWFSVSVSVSVIGHESVSWVSVTGQCYGSVSWVSVSVMGHESVSCVSVSVIGQCHGSVSWVSVMGQCQWQ